jgi:pimeloyl-ACP methyl ester carboxylesterase
MWLLVGWTRHLGNATDLVVLNKCGHFPHLENPAAFNRILANFLKSRR